MTPSNRRISSKDVAVAAGVSRSTVSFVLNGREDMGIAASTRERVWEVARELCYSPSPEAKSLKLGRSAVVLCLLPDWPIAGPAGVLLEQLSARLAEAGLTMLAHQRASGDDLSRVLSALTPTAVIAMCPLSDAEVALAARRGIGLTAFMADVPGIDDRAGHHQEDVGRLQVASLAEQGHTCVGYLAPEPGKLDWFSTPRVAGADHEAQRRGLSLITERLSLDDHGGLGTWLRELREQGATGVAAFNDEFALAAMTAAIEAGLDVPRDLSIIGADDSALSRLARPSLSTIRFNLSLEVDRLAALASSSPVTPPVALTEEILQVVLRDSVAPRSTPPTSH